MDNDGFQTVSLKNKKRKNKYNKKQISQQEIISEKLFNKYNEVVTKSKIFNDIIKQIELNKIEFESIRCLALGSFFEEIQPLYQLVLLREIILWKSKTIDSQFIISLYDPAFTSNDIDFINNELNDKNEKLTWKYETEQEWEANITSDDLSANEKTLYYIPHGDLHLLEYLFPLIKPKYYLGNYVFDQLLRVDENDQNMKYLVNVKRQCYKTGKISKNESNNDSDDFQQSVKKTKKRINNKLQKEIIEPVPLIKLYFKDIQVLTNSHTTIEQGPWLSAFSSLALHEFEKEEE
ncbi:hypothetical protein ACO0SA_002241 [Hanseniaspora valbyensis]